MKNQPFHIRLGFARVGIVTVWRRERSFRTHVAFATGAWVSAIVLQPGVVWIALVALATAFVLALEMLNSALEYLMDQVHPTLAAEIGHAKDAAAGAVLIASMAAIIVGSAMVLAAL